MCQYFPDVTALDLIKPAFDIPGVRTVAGDATRLAFEDGAFDCVFCAEVLEHIPPVEVACKELLRVAKHEVIVGVPYKQDTRVGRTTCPHCRRSNPPYGHVNTFDEARLAALFPGTRVAATSLVGENREFTNPVSAFLMDCGRNPWGVYAQDEPCIFCGAKMTEPEGRTLVEKICSSVAIRLNRLQEPLIRSQAIWIHMVFSKDPA